jgi:DNA-binding LacI/PurR family transcriptional regulator
VSRPETRARVRAAARELGYVTGHTGRALATRRTRKIAVVSAELSNPFYPALIAPLQVALDRHGLQTVLVTESEERPLG